MTKDDPQTRICTVSILAATLLLGIAGCASVSPDGTEGDPGTAGNAPFRADVSANPVPAEAEIATELTHQALQQEHDRAYADARKSESRDPASTAESPLSTLEPARPSRSSRFRSVRRSGGRDGGTITYVVKEHDTLMKVSFVVFGDVYRWKEIYEQNRVKVGPYYSLAKGTRLTIRRSHYVVPSKNGTPYFVKKRDTLWRISNGIYGTPWKWPKLWHNNPELIHDPNRIYAGFYLYYLMTSREKRYAERMHLFNRGLTASIAGSASGDSPSLLLPVPSAPVTSPAPVESVREPAQTR